MDLSSPRNIIVIILVALAVICGILGVRESFTAFRILNAR